MYRPPVAKFMSEDRQQMFSDRYASGDMPWDSGITPPEIFDILAELPPGNALDLGCGTGTVICDLLRHGWRADGIDFVERAIDLARAKLSAFAPDSYRLYCCDVARLDALPDLRAPYGLIIDIGCGHSIDKSRNQAYANGISERLAPGGSFMLYASHPRPDSSVGWTPLQVARLFTGKLELYWEQRSHDTALGVPSSWYRLRKPPVTRGNLWHECEPMKISVRCSRNQNYDRLVVGLALVSCGFGLYPASATMLAGACPLDHVALCHHHQTRSPCTVLTTEAPAQRFMRVIVQAFGHRATCC